MNMKRVHANHIIAELTRRLADRDEELDKHLCRIHKLEEDAEDDCSCIETQRVEITRLKALCQEPVDKPHQTNCPSLEAAVALEQKFHAVGWAARTVTLREVRDYPGKAWR